MSRDVTKAKKQYAYTVRNECRCFHYGQAEVKTGWTRSSSLAVGNDQLNLTLYGICHRSTLFRNTVKRLGPKQFWLNPIWYSAIRGFDREPSSGLISTKIINCHQTFDIMSKSDFLKFGLCESNISSLQAEKYKAFEYNIGSHSVYVHQCMCTCLHMTSID